MSKNKPGLIDTNLLIRYLIEDDLKKVDAIEKLLKEPNQKLILLDITFAETIWTLKSFYNLTKEQIIRNLIALINIKSIVIPNPRILEKALDYYTNYNISFIDAYQAAFANTKKLSIYSYDKDFDKLPDLKRLEPS